MYDSRHNELEKLMNLMNKLNKELQFIYGTRNKRKY